MSAGVARSGRVTRVNESDGQGRRLRLVGHKSAELKECPVSQLPSHLTIEAVASLPNTRQGFKRECLTRGKRRLNELFADAVIDVSLVIRRSPRHAVKVTLGALGSLALQKGADTLCAAAAGFHGLARIRTAFAVRRQGHDAQVNAENPVRLHEGRVGQVDGREQIEVAADKGEVAFSLLEGEKPALIVPAHERQAQTAINRPDGDFALVNVPSQDTVIVGNRAVGLERALNLLVEFVGVRDFGIAPDNDLRRQVKSGTGRRIRSFVERVLAERLVRPRPLADAVTRGVGAGKRLFQGFRLCFGDDQFDLCGEFQGTVIIPGLL